MPHCVASQWVELTTPNVPWTTGRVRNIIKAKDYGRSFQRCCACSRES
jgi:hypothetical protein